MINDISINYNNLFNLESSFILTNPNTNNNPITDNSSNTNNNLITDNSLLDNNFLRNISNENLEINESGRSNLYNIFNNLNRSSTFNENNNRRYNLNSNNYNFNNFNNYNSNLENALQSSFEEKPNFKKIATKQVVKNLKKIKFDENNNLFKNSNCPIYYLDFEHDEEVIILPCNHCFIPDAIKKWLLEESNECPVCRLELSYNEIKINNNNENNYLEPILETNNESLIQNNIFIL